jgi:agmatinase
MSSFDPNAIALPNGNIFGFPVAEEEATIHIIPVPWDATASYGKGTSDGPKAILDASLQLDFYHPLLDNAFDTKVFMSSISDEWKKINDKYCLGCIEYVDFLENGGILSESIHFRDVVSEINNGHLALKQNLKEKASALLDQGKFVCVLGGEHSTPLGLIEALNDRTDSFGILQIDAHADLRESYEAFEQSHASIMFNVLKSCENMHKLVQVGIRDIAPSEIELIENSKGRVTTFFDWNLKKEQFEGKTWQSQVNEIIDSLPQDVYISFDIDGLRPELCPNTGTPVPGGFSLEQVNYLFFQLLEKEKRIIGFDLNEVAPGSVGEWDANVGARALWNLVVLTEKQRRYNVNI